MKELSRKKEEVIGAMIGLAKACESHEPLPTTTPLLIEGMLVCGDLDIYTDEQLEELKQRIIAEKYTIVPGCRVCANPCGNTSDYDLTQLWERTPEKHEANLRLLHYLSEKAQEVPENAGMDEAFFLYQGLAAVSLDWDVEELEELMTD